MAGIAIRLNLNLGIESKNEFYINKFKDIYKIPSVHYKEEQISTNDLACYYCGPSFDKILRIKKIDNYLIVFQGDFYNVNEINVLIGKEDLLKIDSVYLLFIKFGNNFSEYLNGEFNIIIYDIKSKKTLVTNDRFARIPLFYYLAEDELIIGSERKVIVGTMLKKKNIDPLGLLQVFSIRHNISGRTMFQDLYSLQPAATYVFHNHKIEKNKYFKWYFNDGSKKISRKAIIDEIYWELKNSVKIRLNNKGNILSWLSGGYDSRSIACAINEESKKHVTIETRGEDNSIELSIAQQITDILGYKFIKRKVNIPLLKVFEIASWKTEFSVAGDGHPYMSFHEDMRKKYKYIISGLPGLDTLNGAYVKPKLILYSLMGNFYKRIFNIYSVSYNELLTIFNHEFLDEHYNDMKDDFLSSFSRIDHPKKLDKWDLWFTLERQTHYSHHADLIENDFFKMIYPYCDTNLLHTFLKIPLRQRMFQQLSKDMMYKYFEPVRHIEFDVGRGKLSKNNSRINYLFKFLKSRFEKVQKKSIGWDIKKSIINEYDEIRGFIKKFINTNDSEIKQIFNSQSIDNLISSPEMIYKNFKLLSTLLTFIYSYNFFIKDEVSIPDTISEYYKNQRVN